MAKGKFVDTAGISNDEVARARRSPPFRSTHMGKSNMATNQVTKTWQVYENLCLDGIDDNPEYLVHLIKVLKEEGHFKVLFVVKCTVLVMTFRALLIILYK